MRRIIDEKILINEFTKEKGNGCLWKYAPNEVFRTP